MALDPNPPLEGDMWREDARPGRLVSVLKTEINSRNQQMVTFQTVTIHNKRAQRYPTVSTVHLFRKRFTKEPM